MTMKPKYLNLLKDDKVKRWYENLKAKSALTASVYLRGLGYYCELEKTKPNEIIQNIAKPDFKDAFMDFIRKMEKNGYTGSYIARFKRVLRSWSRFNGIDVKLDVNIRGENESPTLDNERIPNKEELSRLLRKATARGRVSISIMAYAGLRPESLGNYEGTDGLRLKDIKGLRLSENIEFDKIPVMVSVKSLLSKARHQYFSFIGEEGATYIKEYLEGRRREGEELDYDSPLLYFSVGKVRHNSFLRTTLITRDIREAIQGAGLKMRPYVLRAYFSTALDIAESKGLISHPWRQFIMGHKGDIEETYTKREGMVDEGREQYAKCLKFIETEKKGISEEDKESIEQSLITTVLKQVFDFSDKEIEEMINLTDEELQKRIKEKKGMILNNGNSHNVSIL